MGYNVCDKDGYMSNTFPRRGSMGAERTRPVIRRTRRVVSEAWADEAFPEYVVKVLWGVGVPAGEGCGLALLPVIRLGRHARGNRGAAAIGPSGDHIVRAQRISTSIGYSPALRGPRKAGSPDAASARFAQGKTADWPQRGEAVTRLQREY